MDEQEHTQPPSADHETTIDDLEVDDDASESVKGGESLSLNFSRIQYTYTQQSSDGSASPSQPTK